MTLSLEDFLRTELPDRQKRLGAIEKTILEVLGTFAKLFDEQTKAWPYTIWEGRPPSVPTDKLSQSTNAMVLFMLKAFVGGLEGRDWTHLALVTPLLGKTSRWLESQQDAADSPVSAEIVKQLRQTAEATTKTLVEQVAKENRTKSKTF